MRLISALEIEVAFIDEPLVFGAEECVTSCESCSEGCGHSLRLRA